MEARRSNRSQAKDKSASDRLVSAYRRTRYVIELSTCELVLGVGSGNQAVDRILQEHGAKCAAFITAWNPGSRRLSDAENERRHAEFVHVVESRGLAFLPGRGIGEDAAWPAEASLFIIGIKPGAAKRLGRDFGQLAILLKRVGEAAELCFLSKSACKRSLAKAVRQLRLQEDLVACVAGASSSSLVPASAVDTPVRCGAGAKCP